MTAIEHLRAQALGLLGPRDGPPSLVERAILELADRLDAIEIRAVGVTDPGLRDPDGSSLEDRIAALEEHTGTPRVGPSLEERITALEEHTRIP